MEWKEGDIDGVTIRKAKVFSDKRGWLAEVFRSDEIPAEIIPEMGYVSMTVAGETRGPHEHIEQTDCFSFFGPGTFKLMLWDARKDSLTYGARITITGGDDNPVVVVVPPRVVHGYRNISDKDGFVMNFPNRLFSGKDKKGEIDEVRHEDDEGSDYDMDDVNQGA